MDIKTLFERVYQIVSDISASEYMYGVAETPTQMGGVTETQFTVGVEFHGDVPIGLEEEFDALCSGSDWVVHNKDNIFTGVNPEGAELVIRKEGVSEDGMMEYSREEQL